MDTNRLLRITAYMYLAGYAIHGADHIARGMDKTPDAVKIGGFLGLLAGLTAIGFVVSRRRLSAHLAIVVGFVTAVGLTAVHVPPHWSAFSQPFRGGVNALDWASVVVAVLGSLAFGIAGVYALMSERSGARAAAVS